MPGNYPEESIQHSEQGESLKSRAQQQLNAAAYDLLPVCQAGIVQLV